jgi:hypothetical protein
MKHLSIELGILTRLWWEQCLVGSLVGVTATQIVTVAYKGQLTSDGNRGSSYKGVSWLDSETY